MTRPYIMRVEPIDSGESGYRPPSREWMRKKQKMRFCEVLAEAAKEAPDGRQKQN